MRVYETQPIEDPRWAELVACHPRSSVFHTPEWLIALKRTYGYEPKVFTTSPSGGRLENGIVVCEVISWLTGARLVSLPFSDHCEPLVADVADYQCLIQAIRNCAADRRFYVELRPRTAELSSDSGYSKHSEQVHHAIDLRPSIDALYSQLQRSSIQRKIRRTLRDHVELDQGRSELLLEQFYRLFLLTRRRHCLPPAPLRWFWNLRESLGTNLNVSLIRLEGRPIAGMITLRHKGTLTYKYGCSDARFHKVGGVPRLFWQAILQAKGEGLVEFDLGRSAASNMGLIKFKEHLGARGQSLPYWRASDRARKSRSCAVRLPRILQGPFSCLPDRLFRLTGELFYPHAG